MDDDVRVYKNKETGRGVCIRTIPCHYIRTVTIYNKAENLIGHANVITQVDGDKALNILCDICIYDEAERRQGAASEVMEIITNLYEKLVTGTSTSAGRGLCYKFGFKDSKGLFKEDAHCLFYEREKKGE